MVKIKQAEIRKEAGGSHGIRAIEIDRPGIGLSSGKRGGQLLE